MLADRIKRRRVKDEHAFQTGDRVSVPLDAFDDPDIQDGTKYSEMYSEMGLVKLMGTVKNLSKLRNKATVLFDIDGKHGEISIDLLTLDQSGCIQDDQSDDVINISAINNETEPQNESIKIASKKRKSNEANVIKIGGKMQKNRIMNKNASKKNKASTSNDELLIVELPQSGVEKKPEKPTKLAKQSKNKTKKTKRKKAAATAAASIPRSTATNKENADEDIPVSESGSDNSDADAEAEDVKNPSPDIYDFTMKASVTIDQRDKIGAARKYGPQLTGDKTVILESPIALFLIFFPETYVIENVLPTINKKGFSSSSAWKELTYSEFLVWVGLWVAMTSYQIRGNRDRYWNKVPSKVFPAMDFGRFMTRNRFSAIVQMFDLNEIHDPIDSIVQLIDETNKKLQEAIVAGDILCVDESMLKAYHRKLPAKVKIIRKPRPIGNEIRDISDARSKIVIGMELNEGKDRNDNLEYFPEVGATTASLLRLTTPWHGTSRIIVADSWFGSVKSAVQLAARGLFSTLMVKTAHKNFPKALLNESSPTLERGKWVSAMGLIPDGDPISNLIAVNPMAEI